MKSKKKQGENPITVAKSPAPNGLEDLVQVLAKNAPGLKDLTADQLRVIGKSAVFNDLTETLLKKLKTARIDFQVEKDFFLRQYSPHSRRAYRSSLEKLENYCRTVPVEVPAMNAVQADGFISSLKGLSGNTIRLMTAGASSFFTFLSRRYDHIKNPFIGTKARPKKGIMKRPFAIPTAKELNAIEATITDKTLKSAVIMLRYSGLRIGALPTLRISGNRFFTITKGKEFSGKLIKKEIDSLKGLGKRPFKEGIENSLKYIFRKAYRAGIVPHLYSPHDIRHFFAVRLFAMSKNPLKVMQALNHENLATTSNYLRSLEFNRGYN